MQQKKIAIISNITQMHKIQIILDQILYISTHTYFYVGFKGLHDTLASGKYAKI